MTGGNTNHYTTTDLFFLSDTKIVSRRARSSSTHAMQWPTWRASGLRSEGPRFDPGPSACSRMSKNVSALRGVLATSPNCAPWSFKLLAMWPTNSPVSGHPYRVAVAQLAARRSHNPKVVRSILTCHRSHFPCLLLTMLCIQQASVLTSVPGLDAALRALSGLACSPNACLSI